MGPRPTILIVDDEPFNRDYLEQELEDLDYHTLTAANGQEALDRVAAEGIDLVLLDIMMPVLDGFAVLARLKAADATRDIPVIVISAMHDVPNVVRGIQAGAEDYLPKPFDPVLLRARIGACLERKRLRDQEVEYLRQVRQLTHAASAVEQNAFEPGALAGVATRPDELGQLARVFLRMAKEVVAREQRLKRQIEQLQLDIQERQAAAAETSVVYIPMDRRQALAAGTALPTHTQGAALVADLSGSTALTEALALELGAQRGAEEITRQFNRVFAALIRAVHRYRGSVVGFAGDSITCWFDADVGGSAAPANEADSSAPSPESSFQAAALRATACAVELQTAMQQFATVSTPQGTPIALAIKAAVAAGPARRFLTGDPRVQHLEVLAGRALAELAEAEGLAGPGEVVLTGATAAALAEYVTVTSWRGGERAALLGGLSSPVTECPWPPLPEGAVTRIAARPWLLPAVFEKVAAGRSDLLSELRPAAALFVRFDGLDYDSSDAVAARLDLTVRAVQQAVDQHGGALFQLTVDGKGSYLYGAFGAPVAFADDAQRAVAAALDVRVALSQLPFLTAAHVGLAYGPMRCGAYGSPDRRAYGVLGDKTNLAARLMQSADGSILCDEAIYEAAKARFAFEALAPLTVKGKTQLVPVYRPLGPATATTGAGSPGVGAVWLDRLAPTEQLTLKVASVIGAEFALAVLQAIYPDEPGRADLGASLGRLTALGIIQPIETGSTANYRFADRITLEAAYQLMLFAQRRQLHRAVAEWHEQTYASNLAPYYGLLAYHWRQADDSAKAIHYLEQAGEQARESGAYDAALRYLGESLSLNTASGVLSPDYRAPNQPA